MSEHSTVKSILDTPYPLISVRQLAKVQENSRTKVFDVRGTWSAPPRALYEDYLSGHIPNAIFLDWTKHFVAQDVELGLAPIANEESAKRSFTELGINHDDLVVVYDASSHMLAGRIWIAMRHWGFTNVRVLNGGWNRWTAQDLPVSTMPNSPSAGNFQPVLQSGLKIDLEEFIEARGGSCVIDARGAANYAGNRDDPRSGHIPGSVNIPFSAMLDPDTGTFLDSSKVKGVLDQLAPGWGSKPLIATCGAGYAATVILLALAQIGQKGTLFDGSFAVWKRNPTRPIAQA